MFKFTAAMICYTAAALFIYASYLTPEFETLGHGFPQTDREYVVALMLGTAMVAKLLGHIFLLSTGRAR